MPSKYPDLIVVNGEYQGTWWYHCREHVDSLPGLKSDMVWHFAYTQHTGVPTSGYVGEVTPAVKAMCAKANRAYRKELIGVSGEVSDAVI
mgnify:CR=1 FL=1